MRPFQFMSIKSQAFYYLGHTIFNKTGGRWTENSDLWRQRQDGDRRGARVNAAGLLGAWDALHPVNPRLVLQVAVDVAPRQADARLAQSACTQSDWETH